MLVTGLVDELILRWMISTLEEQMKTLVEMVADNFEREKVESSESVLQFEESEMKKKIRKKTLAVWITAPLGSEQNPFWP